MTSDGLTSQTKSRGKHPAIWLAIAAFVVLIHRMVFPFAIHIHPDTTGLIVSGEALAAEGKALQPFRWDYVFEHLGKINVSSEQPVVTLEEDQRVEGVKYPHGYSWIVATGNLAGLSTDKTCQFAFYLTMFGAAFCWLTWASRWEIPLPVALVSLAPLVMNGPATVTDPFGYLAAVVLLLILSSDFNPRWIIAAFLVMAFADLIRYAAILLIFFWFGAWMFRPITWTRRFWICVSCVAVVAVDTAWKFLSSGGLDPMSEFSGGWPDSGELARACVYAITGGWTPISTWLKALLVGFAGLGMLGAVLAAIQKQFPRWIGDVLFIQAATIFVLSVAQYKYGADFTQAPISIARYWKYCAPGLICVHMFGLAYLGSLLPARQDETATNARLITRLSYAAVIVASLVQWNIADRGKWQKYKLGSDNFLRRATNHDIHQYLEEQDLVAVLADAHESVFGFTKFPQQKIKSVYYMSGFESNTEGKLALVLNSSKRGLMVKDKLDEELKLLEFVEISEKKHISLYALPSKARIVFEQSDGKTPKLKESAP